MKKEGSIESFQKMSNMLGKYFNFVIQMYILSVQINILNYTPH